MSSTKEGLAIDFSVKKTLKPEPNVASIKIYNLAPHTRDKLTSPKVSRVRLEAGYLDRVSQIYLGDVRAVSPGEVQGPNIITELTSGDGEKEMQTSRMDVPIGAKTTNGEALKKIAKALGVGIGNVPKVSSILAIKGSAIFPRATAISGNTARILSDFCRSAGLEWSIQDGVIQVLDLGFGLEIKPYTLSADSGLIGSPTVSNEGNVSATTLMIPELRPGMRVEFDSLSVKGLHRIDQVEYSGQTHGQDWSIKMTCGTKKKAKK